MMGLNIPVLWQNPPSEIMSRASSEAAEILQILELKIRKEMMSELSTHVRETDKKW